MHTSITPRNGTLAHVICFFFILDKQIHASAKDWLEKQELCLDITILALNQNDVPFYKIFYQVVLNWICLFPQSVSILNIQPYT
uniref:Uncharacterized protein n=1 Tax=Pyxicephalus adspersus TaxID=30357 RepID=A0AAV3ANG0_PYXAD|nr:TPA: hypothetical protein GDO54_009286 [Pyxicephalus adspersus]